MFGRDRWPITVILKKTKNVKKLSFHALQYGAGAADFLYFQKKMQIFIVYLL